MRIHRSDIRRTLSTLPLACAVLLLVGGTPPPPDDVRSTDTVQASEELERLARLPDHLPELSALPLLAGEETVREAEELSRRARVRDYEGQVRQIARRYFQVGVPRRLRQQGLEELREFVDPASFLPMLSVLHDERDDVLLCVLDHFASQGDWGQASLAYAAIHHRRPAIRHEARMRLRTPTVDPVRYVIESHLRNDDHDLVGAAGALAGQLNMLEAVPHLIHAQSVRMRRRPDRGQSYILVGTRRVEIEYLIPVVSRNTTSVIPVPGYYTDGVIIYADQSSLDIRRTPIHYALISMTSPDFGRSTAELGYDAHAWRMWYEQTFIPHQRERQKYLQLASPPSQPDDGDM